MNIWKAKGIQIMDHLFWNNWGRTLWKTTCNTKPCTAMLGAPFWAKHSVPEDLFKRKNMKNIFSLIKLKVTANQLKLKKARTYRCKVLMVEIQLLKTRML